MKEIVRAVEHHSVEKAKEVAGNALKSIHQRSRKQYNGIHKLMELYIEVGLIDGKEQSQIQSTWQTDR